MGSAPMKPSVILEFRPTTPGKIEVRRDRDGWWVFDRDDGWKPISEAVARVLTEKGGAADDARSDHSCQQQENSGGL
jgi:hypothetical protein